MKSLSLPIRFGLVTSAVLIAYFLVLSLFNNHIHPAFSFFNAVITTLGIFEVIRYKKIQDYNDFSYGEGFKTGIITGFIASFLFTLFFLFYATEININFLPDMLHEIKSGFNVDIGMVSFVVFIMGLATTVIATFTVMQFFKK